MKKSTRTEIINFAMACSLTAIAIMSGESLGKWKSKSRTFTHFLPELYQSMRQQMKLRQKIQTEICGDLPGQKIMRSVIQSRS